MRQNCQLTQWILVLLVAIVIGIQVSPALAFADPRINRLESQVRYLQSQVRQLDRQINQTQFSPQHRDPQVVPPTITPQRTQSPESTSTLDRLATLVVEQKRRLEALEARLDRLDPNPDPPESGNFP